MCRCVTDPLDGLLLLRGDLDVVGVRGPLGFGSFACRVTTSRLVQHLHEALLVLRDLLQHNSCSWSSFTQTAARVTVMTSSTIGQNCVTFLLSGPLDQTFCRLCGRIRLKKLINSSPYYSHNVQVIGSFLRCLSSQSDQISVV